MIAGAKELESVPAHFKHSQRFFKSFVGLFYNVQESMISKMWCRKAIEINLFENFDR